LDRSTFESIATCGSDIRPYEKTFESAETGEVTSLPTTKCERWLPGQFPEELRTDFQVATGAVLRLRPIRCDDAAKLVAFHTHLSFDSIYRRYFSLHPVLSTTEVKHFTQVDYVNRLALVVEDGDELVAVGRYDRYPEGTTAEVAFVVRDDYQHLGLGHRLLDALAAAAWERGITDFSAETLSSNRAMMSVFRHSGFPVTSTSEYNEISVRFPIDPETVLVPQPR
jgi:GNAT superfamily N-acetyltransferase